MTENTKKESKVPFSVHGKRYPVLVTPFFQKRKNHSAKKSHLFADDASKIKKKKAAREREAFSHTLCSRRTDDLSILLFELVV